MPRDYFRKAEPGFTIASGTIITDVQTALNASGAPAIDVDGLFGNQTEGALSAFQAGKHLPVTGTVSDSTWTALFQTTEPPIFERCLQVTASFEGTRFNGVVGNFDGAGITWGIIGFTLLNGELGAVLAAVNAENPALIEQIFGSNAAEIMRMTGPATNASEKLAWANSISRGSQNLSVAEPWQTCFRNLGAQREVQKVQIDRARDVYWKKALEDARNLGCLEELDLLLMYDTAVQNGGMDAQSRRPMVEERFRSQSPATEQEKRRIIAEVVADTASPQWRKDVLDRKIAIATGEGSVHGGKYNLTDWGFLDGFKPQSIN